MQNTNQVQDVSQKNAALREELWAKGCYVQEVGQLGRIDFLIVSYFEPDPQAPPNAEPILEDATT